MDWYATRIGNAKGTVSINGTLCSLSSNKRKSFPLTEDEMDNLCLDIDSLRGKLGDSEESFIFFYTRITPDRENFILSASFRVTDASRSPGWQAGYGIFAADTVASASPSCRFRNLVSLGRHRGLLHDAIDCGLRVVSGYRDPEALNPADDRKMDPSRVFHNNGLNSMFQTGEELRFCLEKTNRGLRATMRKGNMERKISFPGCDVLTVQEPESIFIGFAVAGNLSVQISGIRLSISPGKVSQTSGTSIKNFIPDYPFSRALVKKSPFSPPWHRVIGTIFVSPSGNPRGQGTPLKPFDLQTALNRAGANSEIILQDGIYYSECPYRTSSERIENVERAILIRAEHPGAAVLDGSQMKIKAPILLLQGNGQKVRGLVFRRGPSVGLMICGNRNVVEDCEAFENGDTGILICAYPGASRGLWPSHNTVSRCISYRNCDIAGCNADGFGAKLSVGEGNRFIDCTAHHNVDDGFDLFTKRNIGAIGAVLLEDCTAYENGREVSGQPDGSGFKLGGEGIAVPHIVRGCRAYRNRLYGFTSNSNPSLFLKDLVSRENGADREKDNYHLNSLQEGGIWKTEGLK